MLKLGTITEPPSQLEGGQILSLEGNFRNVLEPVTSYLFEIQDFTPTNGSTDLFFEFQQGTFVTKNKLPESFGSILNQAEQFVREQFLTQAPHYEGALEPTELHLRLHEEANRSASPAREDLLHIDALPHRPTHGKRVLRLCVNLDPDHERVWATSEKFPELLQRYSMIHRLPMHSEDAWTAVSQGWFRSILGERTARTPYDGFMLRLRHFLQNHEPFQDQAIRKLWNFPSYSAWAIFGDSISFAQLRGRMSLEVSYLIPIHALESPDHSPLAHLVKTGIESRLKRAA